MLMFLTYIIKSLLLIIYVMLMVAFYTILERKIIAYIQTPNGPNLVGPFGLLQAIADGLKLLVKQTIIPQTANIMIFIASPLINFNLSYLGWCIIPFDLFMLNYNFKNYLIFKIRLNFIDHTKFFDIFSQQGDWWIFRFLTQILVGKPFFEYSDWIYPTFYKNVSIFQFLNLNHE